MQASGSVRPDHFLLLIHYTAQFDAVPTEFPEETESASLATGMRGPVYSIRTVDLIGRVACHVFAAINPARYVTVSPVALALAASPA